MSRREMLEPMEMEPTARELEIIEEIRKFEIRSPWQIQEARRHVEIIEGYLAHLLDSQPARPDGARVAELHTEGLSVSLWKRFDTPTTSMIEREWEYPNRETIYQFNPYRPQSHQSVDPLAALTGYQVLKYEKELAETEYHCEKSTLGEFADKLEASYGTRQAANEIA